MAGYQLFRQFSARIAIVRKFCKRGFYFELFQFLLSEKDPRGNEHMGFVLLLLRIVEIIMAPKLTRSFMPYL